MAGMQTRHLQAYSIGIHRSIGDSGLVGHQMDSKIIRNAERMPGNINYQQETTMHGGMEWEGCEDYMNPNGL